MTFYKLRHRPSGLYYKPSKHRQKANLSKTGKVYQRRPSIYRIGDTYRYPVPEARNGYEERTVVEHEWEVVAYEVG